MLICSKFAYKETVLDKETTIERSNSINLLS